MKDSRRAISSVVVGAVVSAGVMFVLTWVYERLFGHGWWVPVDAGMGTIPGRALLHGHLSQVYANRYLYELPLSLPFTGAVGMVSAWLRLTPGPLVILNDACFLALTIPLAYVARGLAWDLGARRRLVLIQVVTVLVAAVPEAQWGHPEDVMALVFVIQTLRAVIRSQFVLAAVYLSLAISAKQWALMLLPLVVLATPAGRRRHSLVYSVLLPAVLAIIFLVASFHRTLADLAAPQAQVDGFPGHPWIDGTWLGPHSSQANRMGAVLLAVLVTWLLRRRLGDPVTLVCVAAVVLILRPLTETINYSYYWTPGIALAIIASVSARPHPRLATWVAAVGAVAWSLPRSNDLTAQIWWAGEVLLLALAAYQLPLLRAHAARAGAEARPTGETRSLVSTG